jgi:hypothetical protein
MALRSHGSSEPVSWISSTTCASDASCSLPLWVNCAGLTFRPSRPVYPEHQTFPDQAGTSQKCQERSFEGRRRSPCRAWPRRARRASCRWGPWASCRTPTTSTPVEPGCGPARRWASPRPPASTPRNVPIINEEYGVSAAELHRAPADRGLRGRSRRRGRCRRLRRQHDRPARRHPGAAAVGARCVVGAVRPRSAIRLGDDGKSISALVFWAGLAAKPQGLARKSQLSLRRGGTNPMPPRYLAV